MRDEAAFDAGSIRNPQSAIRNSPAFTLIELLVVISIIALLAAFTIPVLHTVARKKILDRTRGEMEQMATAIDRYKAAYGFYPPSNPLYPNTDVYDVMFSPLYYELLGTTNINSGGPASPAYQTLDNSGVVPLTAANVLTAFGVSGFINCSKGGTGEHEPMIWTVAYGKGRVFYSALGHQAKEFEVSEMATMLLTTTGRRSGNPI